MESVNTILQKYLSGIVNPNEKQRAEEWIKKNPEEFDHLKQLWQVPTSISFQDVDVTSAMQAIDIKIEKTLLKSPRNVQFLITRVAAAAAVIVILVSSFLFVQNQVQREMITLNNNEIVQDLELSDGSQIALNKGSVLVYPKSFSRHYRNVELQSGNAFFEVSKDSEKPFVIQTPHGQVKVLGTSFNIFVGFNKTEVFVKTGRVELINEKTNKTIQLSSEKAGIILSEEVVLCKDVSKNYLSWRIDRLGFKNAGLAELMESLERHFQKPIRYASDSYPSIQFNGVFDSNKLSEILKVVGLTCHLEYQILDNEIVLSQAQ